MWGVYYDDTGLTGETYTATWVDDYDIASTLSIRYATSIFGTTNTAKVWIKKDSNTSRFPEVQLRYNASTDLGGEGMEG